jgi:hypothetical protein
MVLRFFGLKIQVHRWARENRLLLAALAVDEALCVLFLAVKPQAA